jgi:hypothetical protein
VSPLLVPLRLSSLVGINAHLIIFLHLLSIYIFIVNSMAIYCLKRYGGTTVGKTRFIASADRGHMPSCKKVTRRSQARGTQQQCILIRYGLLAVPFRESQDFEGYVCLALGFAYDWNKKMALKLEKAR